MTIDAWITLAGIVVLLGLLITERIPPAAGVVGTGVVFLLVGVIPPEEAFQGFSSPAVITVAALYIVARAIDRSGALAAAVDVLLRAASRPRRGLARLLLPVAAASAFLNNTPIVAALAPAISSWANRRGVPVSRYLMPLSYATILGGVATTIGTSTNLVVSGLLEARGMPGFTLFALTPIGLPLALLGVTAVVVLAPRLLPDRVGPVRQVLREPRRYAVDVVVDRAGPLDGVTVEEAGLRNLHGLYLAAIEQSGTARPAAGHDRLSGDAVMTLVGAVESMAEVLARPGLHLPIGDDVVALRSRDLRLVEVVVGADSRLVGRTLKDERFRAHHDAAVLALHRGGEPLPGKLGDVPLRPGDALLLVGDEDLPTRLRDRDDFVLVAPVVESTGTRDVRRTRASVGIVVAMVLVASTGVVPILHASLAAVLALLLSRTLSLRDARDAVDLDVLLMVAGSFALGAAVERSGLAEIAATGATASAAAGGRLGGVLAVVAGTMLLTEPLSNAAAAALMLPIGLSVAAALDGDPMVFAAAVAVAASASFLTPIGYQTNTMVYGLGGYRFSDYARLGAPLTVLSLLVITTGVLLLAW